MQLPQNLQTLIRKIAEGYKPEKIMLFGSYAEGRATGESDADLLVIKQTDAGYFARIREVRKLVQPQTMPLDILVLTPQEYAEKKQWVNHIAYIATKNGITVYERKYGKLA